MPGRCKVLGSTITSLSYRKPPRVRQTIGPCYLTATVSLIPIRARLLLHGPGLLFNISLLGLRGLGMVGEGFGELIIQINN